MNFELLHQFLAPAELLESSDAKHQVEVHFSPKGRGNLGDIIVFMGPGIDKIARMLGIPDGWKVHKLGNLWSAYSSGDRLTLFTHRDDFEEDELEDAKEKK